MTPAGRGIFARPKDGVRRVRIARATTGAVMELTGLDRLKASSLCRLSHEHVYSLHLAKTLLPNVKAFDAVHDALTGTPSDRQPSRIIREKLERLDQETDGRAMAFLERLAIFMAPIDEATLWKCYQSVDDMRRREKSPREQGSEQDQDDEAARRLVVKTMRRLLKDALILRVKAEIGVSYTLHPVIRGYVFQQLHGAGTDLLPNLTLPGFTAAGAEVHPGIGKAADVVRDMFERIIAPAEQEVAGRLEGGAATSATALRSCRSAFGIIRSRMGANTVCRWTDYDEYLTFLLRTVNLARSLSKDHWDFAESADPEVYNEDPDGPLYADELAWLYNEMGIASHAEGAVLDALAIWEQGLAINHVIDRDDRIRPYVVQSLCNLGAANIESGNLPRAEQYLREGLDASYQLGDEDHAGRMLGYLALVEHLRANLTEANDLYEEALERIGKENPRARSFFLFHQSNLLIKLGQMDSAARGIEMSLSPADKAKGNYPDLTAYARSARGHLLRCQKKFSEALLEYNSARDMAHQIGIRKLEADILSELSRLALDLGDAEVAKNRAIEALLIANELGLGLRQTHGLVVLGKATLKAGPRDLGIAYLRHAKRLADQQEYRLRGSEAEEELHRQGEWRGESRE